MANAVTEGYHFYHAIFGGNDAAVAMNLNKCAFNARKTYRHLSGWKKHNQCRTQIDDSIVLLSVEFPLGGCNSPKTIAEPLLCYTYTLIMLIKSLIRL
jgi:hypothetical protein